MNRVSVFILITVILGFVGISLALSPEKSENSADVAATIFPIYDIAKNIAGDEIDVALILPPGASPHTFETTPSALRSLQNVKTVYAVGHGLDNWTNQISESIGTEITLVDKQINLQKSDKGDFDPHYYLTIENAWIIAQTIERDLSRRFPEYTDQFKDNLNLYLSKLDEADKQIRSNIENAPNKNIVTLHDAWYYFAKEYGINIVGTFEPSAGREPTPRYLVELTQGIKTANVSTIFSEPQLSTENISEFVKDNNLKISEIDPIGGIEGFETYIQLMLKNAKTISQNK